MPENLLKQLEATGRWLLRSHAQLRLTWGLAAVAAWMFVQGLADLWLRMDRSDRMATWAVFLLLLCATAGLVYAALRRPFTPDGIAATLEKTFPELDNRLINYLQFLRNPEGDHFKAAYVRAGLPAWQHLDLKKLRDPGAHRRSRRALCAALGLLLLPGVFFGQAWGLAIWRTVNPFSAVEPPSLTSILEIKPGSTAVLQGQPLLLSCSVKGFPGHQVELELEPADGPKSTYALGRLDSRAPKVFSHQIQKVATQLRYRFRAGDAPRSAWFLVGTRPPPAFTKIAVEVAPPAYMKLAPRRFNPRKERLIVPSDSQLRVQVGSNVPLQSVRLEGGGGPAAFTPADGPTLWSGTTAPFVSGNGFALKACDTFGGTVEEEVPVAFEEDKPPKIEILSPLGRASLAPGEYPRIEFRVSDDFGVAKIALEQLPPDATSETKGTLKKEWTPKEVKAFSQIWKAEKPPEPGTEIAYRLTAWDNRPKEPNHIISSLILFRVATPAEAAKERQELEQKAQATVQMMLELQKNNLAETERLQKAPATATADEWKSVAQRQEQIRNLMRDLLENPLQPLGGLQEAGQKLYLNEMVLAIETLRSIPAANPQQKPPFAREAATLETKILRQLSFAPEAAEESKAERRISGLSALLGALISGQTGVLEQTRALVETRAKPGGPVVEAQDKLGEEMNSFLAACQKESDSGDNDAGFKETLQEIRNRSAEWKIAAEMVIASERLEQNKAAESGKIQERVLAHLQALNALIEKIKLQQEAEKRSSMIEAVKQAKDKLTKVEDLHHKMKEAMEQVRGTKDKDTKANDQLEEAYTALLQNTQEVMLDIPKDLHVFTELNVANDLVEDVFSVFQEIEQQAEEVGKQGQNKVSDLGYTKEDELLQQMGEAKERLDAMEMWLGEKPENNKVTTESFDQKEMPESGIALAELATAAQDLVSDLLKENENTAKDADDSAVNHASPDFLSGWEVMEGNLASFGAQGKSGNQRPDHKEQDGRSNVGRQGMAVGETAAGSGTISEGDKNIEARRTEDPTQSGQVDLKGKADTRATGGGKLGTGKADDLGMSGGKDRMDSKEAGSWEGMAALMAKRADAIYAKASLKNVRADSLKEAAHHLRQSGDAIANGDIQQMREFRKMATSELMRGKAQLESGAAGGTDGKHGTGVLNNVIESAPDMAPPPFRDKVSEYYKALNGSL